MAPHSEGNDINPGFNNAWLHTMRAMMMMMIGLNPGPRARTVKPGPRHLRTRPDPGQNRLGPHKGNTNINSWQFWAIVIITLIIIIIMGLKVLGLGVRGV